VKAGRPSATAHLIARSLVFLSHDPLIAPLIPGDAVEASLWFMRASSPWTRRLVGLMGKRWFRDLVWFVERHSVPGMMLHYALRKRALEETAREAVRDGYRQVVVLGAGFDTLALRLSREFPGPLFLEIDHPATQRVKREALAAQGASEDSLVLLPLDLARERLEDGIRRVGRFHEDVDTLFIAEGLLMYLEAADVDGVFRFCRTRGGARPRFALTFMERLEDGRIAFRGQSQAVDAWLRLRGEPFRWGVPVAEMPRYLRERGFTCREIATPDLLRERYLAAPELRDLALADGDHFCLAGAEGVR
jgi:methyltransferase (TIGR00027 family)